MKFLVGIDEAGRGPLAGPMAVGAFVLPSRKYLDIYRGVRESKQLSPEQREHWFGIIEEERRLGRADYAVSFCQAATIDALGLTRAASISIRRSLNKLEKSYALTADAEILLDGLLHAPAHYVNQRTIIGGDEQETIIALASICAKVLRDRKMVRLAREFPLYGFEAHKGYATSSHYRAIQSHGICPLHRRSFLKDLNIAGNELLSHTS